MKSGAPSKSGRRIASARGPVGAHAAHGAVSALQQAQSEALGPARTASCESGPAAGAVRRGFAGSRRRGTACEEGAGPCFQLASIGRSVRTARGKMCQPVAMEAPRLQEKSSGEVMLERGTERVAELEFPESPRLTENESRERSRSRTVSGHL